MSLCRFILVYYLVNIQIKINHNNIFFTINSNIVNNLCFIYSCRHTKSDQVKIIKILFLNLKLVLLHNYSFNSPGKFLHV